MTTETAAEKRARLRAERRAETDRIVARAEATDARQDAKDRAAAEAKRAEEARIAAGTAESERYDARMEESKAICRADAAERCDTIGDAAAQDEAAGDKSRPRQRDAMDATGVIVGPLNRRNPERAEAQCRRAQYSDCMKDEQEINREEAAKGGLEVKDVDVCEPDIRSGVTRCRPKEQRTYEGERIR